jgi:hypothetical protein
MNRSASTFTVSGCNQAVTKSPTQFACSSTLDPPWFATFRTQRPPFVIRSTNTRATTVARLKQRFELRCVAKISATISDAR